MKKKGVNGNYMMEQNSSIKTIRIIINGLDISIKKLRFN